MSNQNEGIFQDLTIDSNYKGDTRTIKIVTGHLQIKVPADLSNLTSVGKNLYIQAKANLSSLTSVGWNLSIEAPADLRLLKSVNGKPFKSTTKNEK